MDFDLQKNFNTIKDSFGKYVVTPVTNFGLGGFVFDIEGATNIDLAADITDHYTESNINVQDHIAIRPKRIRLDTFVGELAYIEEGQDVAPVQNIARKLTVLNSYLPVLTSGAQQIKDIFDGGRENLDFGKIADSALNLYSLVKNLAPPTTKQQQAYQYFKALMENKILVSCQTPFEFCTNMAVEAVFATQDESTRFVSNFSIVLKEIRMVETLTTTINTIGGILDRAGIQDSAKTSGGKIQGADVSSTQRVDLFDKFGSMLQ